MGIFRMLLPEKNFGRQLARLLVLYDGKKLDNYRDGDEIPTINEDGRIVHNFN